MNWFFRWNTKFDSDFLLMEKSEMLDYMVLIVL